MKKTEDERKVDEALRTARQKLADLSPERRAKLLRVVAMKLAKRYVPGDREP